MEQVDANKVIQILGSKIANAEIQNAMLQAQLESGDTDGKQDSEH